MIYSTHSVHLSNTRQQLRQTTEEALPVLPPQASQLLLESYNLGRRSFSRGSSMTSGARMSKRTSSCSGRRPAGRSSHRAPSQRKRTKRKRSWRSSWKGSSSSRTTPVQNLLVQKEEILELAAGDSCVGAAQALLSGFKVFLKCLYLDTS